MNNHKLLIIGLDGVSFDLLDPWLKKGELPHLFRLKKEGCFGNLRTVPNLHSAAAWTSLVTGKNPGKHGIFFFVERDQDLKYKFFTGADRKSKTIWQLLSEFGKTVGVVNVPMTFPAEHINGIFVSGLDSPSIRDPRSIFPSELKDKYEILRNKYDITPSVQDLLLKEKPDLAVEKWLDIASYRKEFCKQVMQDYSFDFFMVTFIITDWANHNLWKYFDNSSPLYNDQDGKNFGCLMLKVYKKMDSMIGELIESFGRDANVLIVSDHGAGQHQFGSLFLTDWLIQNNFMYLKNRNISNLLKKEFLSMLRTIPPSWMKRYLRDRFPTFFSRLRNKHRIEVEQNIFEQIDWEKTKAYTEFKWHNIWINLKDRTKFGIVSPNDEYNELCDGLKTKLLKWTDKSTNKPIVKKVLHRSEIYAGPHAHRAPDLQIWWNNDLVISAKDKISLKIRKELERGWSGDHRPNGIFISWGPQFKKGIELDKLSIYDVAPTALYLFNAPMADDIDGRIVKEAFV